LNYSFFLVFFKQHQWNHMESPKVVVPNNRPPGGPCGRWLELQSFRDSAAGFLARCAAVAHGAAQLGAVAGAVVSVSKFSVKLSETWSLLFATYNMYNSSSVRSFPNDLALCCPHKSRRFQWASSLAASVVGSQGKASRSLTDVIRCKSCLIWVIFIIQLPYLTYLTYQHIQLRVNFITQHNCIQPRIVPRFRRSSCGDLQTRCWALLDFRGPPSGALGFPSNRCFDAREPWEKRSPGRRVTEIAGEAQALGGAAEKKVVYLIRSDMVSSCFW